MSDPAPDRPAVNAAAKVEAEWQRLERRRIEEERAEAREDAELSTREPPARRRIPWGWLVLALVAGVVAAVVINRFFVTVPRGPAP